MRSVFVKIRKGKEKNPGKIMSNFMGNAKNYVIFI